MNFIIIIGSLLMMIEINLFAVETLENCRAFFFIFDLLSGRVDASNILSLININAPPFSFRKYRFLVPNFDRTNYGMF